MEVLRDGSQGTGATFSMWPLVRSDLGGVLAQSWGLQCLQLTEEERNRWALLGIYSHHGGQQLPQG